MLYVKTPEEVLALIESEFSPLEQAEFVALSEAVGRVLAEDIAAREYVPDFDRSTVDGFAVAPVTPSAAAMPSRRSCPCRPRC